MSTVSRHVEYLSALSLFASKSSVSNTDIRIAIVLYFEIRMMSSKYIHKCLIQ